MLNLDFAKSSLRAPALERGAVRLRAPQLSDYEAWRALREESRAHLTRWEPDWTKKDVEIEAFRTRLRLQEKLFRAAVALSFFVCLKDGGRLVGGVTLSDIRRQAAQSAVIGYWIGAPFLRRGHGGDAVAAVVDYAIRDGGLNRIEAACQPGNSASLGLLQKLGFKEEGFARDYLHINGAWRDHLLFSLIARDYCGAPPAI
ncbi:MAG TPA: GNAT family protein [Parvularculaceae bacterium]|nr:GNAT family protein [Parvularculaceae bacterium]HNS86360.1 GNAT family protein [Parvularculaceae bacterium]